jgi:hypothetical protein
LAYQTRERDREKEIEEKIKQIENSETHNLSAFQRKAKSEPRLVALETLLQSSKLEHPTKTLGYGGREDTCGSSGACTSKTWQSRKEEAQVARSHQGLGSGCGLPLLLQISGIHPI